MYQRRRHRQLLFLCTSFCSSSSSISSALKYRGHMMSINHYASTTTDSIDTSSYFCKVFPHWRSGGFESLEETPLQILRETIKSYDDQHFINADSYRGRLKIYQTLMQSTKMMPYDTEDELGDNSLHFLWGFAAQLEWQCRSGRLKFPNLPKVLGFIDVNENHGPLSIMKNYDDTIHSSSWWGRMNFALCVPIYRGAEVAEIDLPYHTPDISGSYMDTMHEFDEVVELWANVFRKLRLKMDKRTLTSYFTANEIDEFRAEIWKAHMASLDVAIPLNKQYFEMLPHEEQLLAKGWIRFVDFLAAARWRTDLFALKYEGAGYLPRRILYDDFERKYDPLNEKELLENEITASREMKSLITTMRMGASDEASIQSQLNFVKIACHQLSARKKFPQLLIPLILQEEKFWWIKLFSLLKWYTIGLISSSTK